MFTIKLTKEDQTTVVACESYKVKSNGWKAELEIHRKMFTDIPPLFLIGTGDWDFEYCYIENSSGKTIDRIGPFSEMSAADASQRAVDSLVGATA